MSLYKLWQDIAYTQKTEKEYNEFWDEYLPIEKTIYEYILDNHKKTIEGSLNELTQRLNVEPVIFLGFLDGINTSLAEELDLDSIAEDSIIKLNIDYEKLYFNMLKAKADWLYNLNQWENILDESTRKDIRKEYNKSGMVINENKIGRNEPCPCGSGKKYKKCCGK